MSLLKVISGGQTGADIAALRIAKDLGLQTGGWMPKGYKTLAGPRPEYAKLFEIHEHSTSSYKDRTFRNVYDSDATLRLAHNFHSPGEICTMKAIAHYDRPYMDVYFFISEDRGEYTYHPKPEEVRGWLQRKDIQVLNVAGNSGEWFEYMVEGYLLRVLRRISAIK